MPIEWTISHAEREVVAIVIGPTTIKHIEEYLDGVAVADALPYRKLFDTSAAVPAFEASEMMALGARIQAYAAVSTLGPVAIVATEESVHDLVRLYATLADTDRPLRVFGDIAEARAWLASREYAGSSAA